MDRFTNFSKLERYFEEDVDFRRITIDRGGRFLILAPHAGGIERGTSELARAIAGNNLSLYLFEGLMPKRSENWKLHITSTRFDEPGCFELIKRYRASLAIHGCVGRKPMIYVGGRDSALKESMIAELDGKGYPVKPASRKYAGVFATNICNRTSTGRGVQLELSIGLRRLLFAEWKNRKGRRTTTELFARITRDIREAIR